MNVIAVTSHIKPFAPGSICLALSMIMMGFGNSVEAHADDAVSRPVPSVELTYQAVTPTGTPRVYEDQDGPTYWREGLGIIQGDQLQVRADIAAGVQPMVRFQAHLDHLPPVTVTSAPWVIAFDTRSLALGQHTIEVQAQLGGRETRLAKRSTEFTLIQAAADAPGSTLAGSGIVTSVEGTEQVLSQGNVTSVPLPNDIIKLPSLIANKSLDGNALVTLDLGATGNAAIKSGKPAVLDQMITARVRPQPTSTAHRYIFSIARNGDTIYTSPSILDADSTRIRLTPKTHDQPGLLSGIVHLYVWGVDETGNYGPVTQATLDVRQPPQAASSGQ